MEPISIALGLAGLGMQIFGGLGAADVAKQQAQISAQSAQISGQVAGDEMQINAQKQQQVQLEAGREKLQNIRNVQQARARGLATATTGGAQFSSGLAGAQASAESQGGVNELGINQNLSIANNVFGINQDIGNKRIRMAQLGSQSALLGGQAATDQGIASLGGALIKSGPIIGSFAKNIGGSGSGMFFNNSPWSVEV